MNHTDPDHSPAPSAETDRTVDEARRDAIARLGKFAAYTAPALLALLAGEKSAHGESLKL